tara:strand:+ start:758 stop:1045 length:288 start_codon:yes stop_codon:yes gene_type:complete
MAGLITMSLDVTKLPKEKFIKGKKGVYYNFTIAINDETKYGNNVSMYDAQTQEERQAKTQRNYLGNGKVVWNDGTIVNAEKEAQVAEVSADGDIF